MNNRSLLLLLIAAAIAGMVALGLRSRLHQDAPGAPQASAPAKVLVATSSIPPGTFIRAEKHLGWKEMPPENVGAGYITQPSRTAEEFNGSVARRSIPAGEPVTDSMLVKSGDGGFMSAVLNPGMRAVSIAVDATSGNAGFVFPGDRVDLIVTHQIAVQMANTTENRIASETFIENVRVLAVDQMLENTENKAVVAKTVTIEVNPKQAEMIGVAGNMGRISLALRSLAPKDAPEAIAAESAAPPHGEEAAPVSPTAAGDALIKDVSATGGANTSGSANTGDIDPFFEMDSPAQKQLSPSPALTNVTKDSDVSKLMNPRTEIAPPVVNVIRGNVTEKIEFKDVP